MTILDHTQDISGTETYRLTQLFDPPEFVKEANHERLHGDPEMLPSHVYADQSTRTWPVHSAPATWMSALFFFDKKAELDRRVAEVAEPKILEAARYFNILPQVEQLKTKIAESVAHDLSRVSDDDFALVWETDEGVKERHYPLRGPQEVKMAAAWFEQYRDEFVWADRRRIAEKIMEKASQYSVPLNDPEMIEKTAGYGHCSSADLASMLAQRADMCSRSHPDLAAEMRKLAQSVSEAQVDTRDQGTRYKIAAITDQYDRETKLNRLYDEGGLDRPEEVMFQLTAKTASEFVNSHIQMPSGTVYEKSAFSELSLDHVQDWLGEEFAEAVSAGGVFVDPEKIAAIAPTLPRGDAEAFDRMASSAGIGAFAKTAATASDGGLTPDALYGLAAQYEAQENPTGDPSVLI